MVSLRTSVALIALALLSRSAFAQFGPPQPPQMGPKLAIPRVFPAPGTYPTTESITLIAPDPAAQIHYTWDGSTPTSASPIYDPRGVLFIAGIYEGDRGLKAGYTLRAIATQENHTDSDILTAQYVIDRRNRDTYVSEEVLPGVRMIRDSDNDKMFLVTGEKACVLIDSGMGRGALREYVAQYTKGLPVKVIFTHNHFDHIGQAKEFIEASTEYIGAADRDGAVRLLQSQGVADTTIDDHLKTVADGEHIDLGERALVVYAAPGHTPGSVVIFDERNGYLFTGDSFGNNSPTIPDVLWMQRVSTPLDGYMAVIKSVREKLNGRLRLMLTGHNDRPLVGEGYLNNLEAALQQLMNKGEAALIPSWRPAGLQQVVAGDRLTDPDWAGINVNRATFLPAPPDEIATLVHIGLQGAQLHGTFKPEVHDYQATAPVATRALMVTAIPTSSRTKRITINGKRLQVRQGVRVALGAATTPVTIEVEAPDGKTRIRYRVTVTKASLGT